MEATAANLNPIAGPATAALLEYGIQSAERQTYTQGKASFTATVYAFEDAEEAYGAYSFLRTPDMAPADLTNHASMSDSHALALTGNLVVEFTGKNLRPLHGEMEMLVVAASGHATWGVYPPLPDRLPKEAMIPRTDRFILGPAALDQFLPLSSGDWLGFSVGTEVALARYKIRGREATLVVADFPTPQLAERQLAKLSSEFNVNGSKPGKSPIYETSDGTFVSFVVSAPSEESADRLLSQVHPGMIITWNVPVPNPNEPSMPAIVVGTIIGTGEICGISLLGGLVFAGVRLLTKRTWPGKVFDRTQAREVIQLSLTGKPINTKDLY